MLRETLQFSVSCHRGHAATAESMHLHRNSILYRIRQATEFLPAGELVLEVRVPAPPPPSMTLDLHQEVTAFIVALPGLLPSTERVRTHSRRAHVTVEENDDDFPATLLPGGRPSP